jgi:hypothetical protein
MNNGGAGAASGTIFNGSAAITLSYNTLGAAPLASPTFTGTGSWDSSTLYVDATNHRIGIGTTTPTHLLELKGTSTTQDFLAILSSDSAVYPFYVGATTNNGFLNLRNSSNDTSIHLDSNGYSYFIGGNVGIGTTAPSQALEVYGNIKSGSQTGACVTPDKIDTGNSYSNGTSSAQLKYYLYNTSSTGSYGFGIGKMYDVQYHAGNLGIHTWYSNEVLMMTLTSAGALQVNGSVWASDYLLSSDERLKENIKPISLLPVNIKYKQFELKSQPGQIRYGVIAQSLEITHPELIRKDKTNGMLSVAYIDLLCLEVANLKEEINILKLKLQSI